MKKFFFLAAASALSLSAASLSANEELKIGVVNFTTCVTDSKIGVKEQENMENIRKQMTSLMEGTEKELKEISAKFEDAEYLDSLSPKAEEELKAKYQALQEDMGRYQNQFYQMMNQAQYQLMQKVNNSISKASEKVAKDRNLDYVMNKEACYYIRSDLDVTPNVIVEMDKTFDLKKVTDNAGDAPQMNAVDETVLDKAG